MSYFGNGEATWTLQPQNTIFQHDLLSKVRTLKEQAIFDLRPSIPPPPGLSLLLYLFLFHSPLLPFPTFSSSQHSVANQHPLLSQLPTKNLKRHYTMAPLSQLLSLPFLHLSPSKSAPS